MNDPAQASKQMGFTSYPEAYGHLCGLWEVLERDLEQYHDGHLSSEWLISNIRLLVFKAKQVSNLMKAQQ